MKLAKCLFVASGLLVASGSAYAFERGDIVVRGGIANVAPDDSSSNIVVGSDLGFGVTVDNNTQLGLNVAYFLSDKLKCVPTSYFNCSKK
ncbi:MAG: outer membrane protein [Arenicella sp.]|jgi:outer membrane protein